jgi:hypothetical protein
VLCCLARRRSRAQVGLGVLAGSVIVAASSSTVMCHRLAFVYYHLDWCSTIPVVRLVLNRYRDVLVVSFDSMLSRLSRVSGKLVY